MNFRLPDCTLRPCYALPDTPLQELEELFGHKKEEYEQKNVFFLEAEDCMKKLLEAAQRE